MKGLHMITWILLIIGGLNWLLVGLTGSDITSWWGGSMMDSLSKLIYVLVGLSAVVELLGHKKCCKMCDSSMGGQKMM
jgi:hypothetical protein